jgi:hypothetical protein
LHRWRRAGRSTKTLAEIRANKVVRRCNIHAAQALLARGEDMKTRWSGASTRRWVVTDLAVERKNHCCPMVSGNSAWWA